MSRTLFNVTEEAVARMDTLIKDLSDEINRLRAELAEKDKRIAELERTHHSMEDDSGRQYAVIPVEWINAAWEKVKEVIPEEREFVLAAFAELGIIPCSKCGGTKKPQSGPRWDVYECDCPNNGWVIKP